MDDGLGLCKNFSIAQSASHFVEDSLLKSGFIVNKEKSIWQPTQKITWLGIEVDLKEKLYTITENRILSILDTLNLIILKLPYTTARQLAKLCGKITSTKFVIGDIVQLKTRNLYNIIEILGIVE